MQENFSLSDIAAVTGNEGLGGSSWAWLVIILLFLVGGNNFGFGGKNTATQEDVAGGFSTSALLSNQREAQNSLFGLQNSMNQGFNGINTSILTQGNAIDKAIASCCCETNRNLDSIKNEMAKNTCDIITNANNNTAAILNYLKDDKIHSLELENSTLKFNASQTDQTSKLLEAIKCK